ncbi:hypothetical protein MIMGU_mgv1a025660mg [Erythranthe guttata]|uniref:Uncharacterized protein n=1 Tax=Erythranthe guttata TaxID=4155 RepID=A0A022QA66_ERYGU|nr:hypothetical protein MIMGU_mgv1a025660mg [Erythranthe guttata]
MGKYHDTEHPVGAFGWAGRDTSGVLSPFNFSRRFPIVVVLIVKLILRAGVCIFRGAQKVVKDLSRDFNGVRRNAFVLSGSKSPSSESFRSSDDRLFSNAKR